MPLPALVAEFGTNGLSGELDVDGARDEEDDSAPSRNSTMVLLIFLIASWSIEDIFILAALSNGSGGNMGPSFGGNGGADLEAVDDRPSCDLARDMENAAELGER